MSEITFSREMGFTRREFDRGFTAAIDNRDYLVDGNRVEVPIGSGRMLLDISEQKIRRIASISLPYLAIDFRFEGLDADQVKEFMQFFDLRYQRGGG